jgi:hypothetical protein
LKGDDFLDIEVQIPFQIIDSINDDDLLVAVLCRWSVVALRDCEPGLA